MLFHPFHKNGEKDGTRSILGVKILFGMTTRLLSIDERGIIVYWLTYRQIHAIKSIYLTLVTGITVRLVSREVELQ